ncbi:Os11g0265900 [Oryza sativa Japonica Group]|uniref:Os11g0265900 protein n=1 Tax=Oryza sativa subsp. japonica TaxID=39947 RepID=A0A0P0Y194_ORYSJ|nr:hypothetical protein EE612_054642 [Oryza sativa]BAT13536.1 Os11g0265900 [Oryza sativa Japonica Group]
MVSGRSITSGAAAPCHLRPTDRHTMAACRSRQRPPLPPKTRAKGPARRSGKLHRQPSPRGTHRHPLSSPLLRRGSAVSGSFF